MTPQQAKVMMDKIKSMLGVDLDHSKPGSGATTSQDQAADIANRVAMLLEKEQ